MFCKPQARVLLVSSGRHSTCCCTLPESHRIHCCAFQNTFVALTFCQKHTLDRHACSDDVPHMQSFMIAMPLISIMCVHVYIQRMYAIHCVTDACLLQIAQQSQQAAAACLAALQLSMLPLAGGLASPPPSSALLTSPNAQIPR